MTIRFQKLSPEYVRQNHPRYYGEDITCFLILKDDTPAGLYGLIDRGVDPTTKEREAEAFLTIFPAFRFRVLGKSFFLNLFDHAFTSGFQNVYTWTYLTSWKNLFQRFESLGIHRLKTPPSWDPDSSKFWFVKHHQQRQSQPNVDRKES